MPSKSPEQKKFMQAVANNPKFAKKVGVPQSVGKDFSTADKNRKTSKGGDMKHSDAKMDKSMMKKVVAKHADMPASKAHKGLKMGGMTGYASGGMPMVMKDGKKVPSFAADGKGKMKMGGSVAPSKMGKVKTGSKPDGIIKKGGTKGKMIAMKMGGKTC